MAFDGNSRTEAETILSEAAAPSLTATPAPGGDNPKNGRIGKVVEARRPVKPTRAEKPLPAADGKSSGDGEADENVFDEADAEKPAWLQLHRKAALALLTCMVLLALAGGYILRVPFRIDRRCVH
jgi:hypothetical protein